MGFLQMKRFLTLVLVFCGAAALFGLYNGKVELDKADGFYKVGETATCSVKLTKDGKPLTGAKVRCTIKWECTPVAIKDFEATGKPVKFSYKADKPGWVYFGFEVLDENGEPIKGKSAQMRRGKPTIVGEIGAIFDAENIRTGVKRPEDFERFWAERRAKLDKVPLEPKFTELHTRAPGIKLFAVEIPTLGDRPATGYFAYPADAKPKSLTAVVTWQSWSAVDAVRSAAINWAKQGCLGFAATWHGHPVNLGKAYYNYKNIKIDNGMAGINDRETWCFGYMYYRVMRVLDFMKSRPEWDGKNLISIGGSLGGAQSAAAAALDKDVTLAVVSVPGFCEFDGAASGHRNAIPCHRSSVRRKIAAGDRRMLDTGAYFDCVNFAPMIKCEIYVCTGFVDEVCPPSNVFAFYNAIPKTTKKIMTTNPGTGHDSTSRNVKGNERLEKLMKSVKISRVDVK